MPTLHIPTDEGHSMTDHSPLSEPGASIPAPPPVPNAGTAGAAGSAAAGAAAAGVAGSAASATTSAPTSAPTPPPTLGTLVGQIAENISALIRGEIDLAAAKAKRMGRKLGLGAGLLAVAGVLALYALGLTLGGIVRAVALALPLWASYLIVALVLFIIVAILALLGIKRIQSGMADKPAPQMGLKQTIDTAKNALTEGLNTKEAQQ